MSALGKRIYLLGQSDYALIEACLLAQRFEVVLLIEGEQQALELMRTIEQSQELKAHQSTIRALEHQTIKTLKLQSEEVVIFFDGKESVFLHLSGLVSEAGASLIDCSSVDWQLKRLQTAGQCEGAQSKPEFPNRYFVLTQFVQQGKLFEQLQKRTHLLIGSKPEQAKEARELVCRLYEPFIKTETQIEQGDTVSVYLSKFILNTHLAFRIAVMNEAAKIAEICGADIETIRRCIGLDARLGKEYLKAGTGFGGTSFMADLKTLAELLNENDATHHLLFKNAIQTNTDQKEVLFRKLWRYYDMELSGKKVAIWGLSYKPDTSDVSESPAIRVIQILLSQGVKISCFDPLVKPIHLTKKLSQDEIADLDWASSPENACLKADALLIFNELPIFSRANFTQIKKTMKRAVIFDGRNLLHPATIESLGFEYHAIGRK